MDDKLNSEMVHHLDHDGKRIILVGTAHVSTESVNLVEAVIADVKPDTVCVELCESRAQAIRQKDRWQEMDIIKVIKEKKAFLLLSNLMLASFQKRIADRLEVSPGQEMIQARTRLNPSAPRFSWRTGISVPRCRGPGETWGCGARSS